MQQFVGWIASAILLFTVLSQIYRQYAAGTSKGVSTFLFAGQIAASAGFTIYSWLVGDKVFIFTNALMLCSAVVGLILVLHHRRREKHAAPE